MKHEGDRVRRVGVALGSNVGDRLANLRKAYDLLVQWAPANSPALQAPVYRSMPVDCPEQAPDFLNTVVEIGYEGEPFELLLRTQNIELAMGRKASNEKNAPRTIDLDLLYFGDCVVDTEKLTVPHPRILKRRFVLQPLHDIRPDLVLPGEDKTMAEHLKHLQSSEPPLTIVQKFW